MEKKNKSKKKDSEKKESKKLPSRYIKQPYSVSAMQADLSRQQIRILVGMMQAIQDGVQQMFEQGKKDEDGQMYLFPDFQDEHVNIDFKFNDVVDRPDAYRHVAEIADKFMHMVFRYEDKSKGEVTLSHFVDKVSYPMRGSKRDKIRFSFTKEQAKAVFNFTMYSRYLQEVAYSAENKYTARLYMLITSARGFDKGHTGMFHWYVGYEELRRILGCDEQDEKGQWLRKAQIQYKHFKSNILKKAEEELHRFADEGRSDCWFEFTELPEDRTGEPERFDFTVHLSTMGKIEDMRQQNNAKMNELADFMLDTWGIEGGAAYTYMHMIDPEKFEGFAKDVHRIAESMESKTIGNPKRYAEESIAKVVDKYKEISGKNATEVQEAQGMEEKGRTISEAQIKDSWSHAVGLKNYTMYLSGVKIKRVGEELYVQCPHVQVEEKVAEWKDKLETACGMRIVVVKAVPSEG